MIKVGPFISIIIPCYNVEGYVREAVESASAQTYPHIEIICVDDGSTDETLAVLKQVEAVHPERITILAGANWGAPAARNKGLSLVKGEWVQFLDADDVLEPGKIEHQVDLIEGEGADFLVAHSERVFLDGKRREGETEKRDPWVGLLRARMGITSANLWRREAVEKVGGWSENLPSNQEYDLMFRLLKAGAKVVFDDACLTVIRHREESITAISAEGGENWKRQIGFKYDVLQYLEKNHMLNEEREAVAHEEIFRKIRALYTKDSDAALALHRQLIPKEFTPASESATKLLYALGYKIVGFEGTEKLRSLVR